MGICKTWAKQLNKCNELRASKSNEVAACCAEQGVPDLCFGYCLTEQPAKQRQPAAKGVLRKARRSRRMFLVYMINLELTKND